MNTRVLLVSTAVLLFLSCSDEDEKLLPDPLFPSQSTFKTSLFIHMVDETGKSLVNVDARLGEEYQKSDLDGWIRWQDINVGASAYVTIEKEGYFNSSRRFYPSSKAPHYFQIVLLPKTKKIFFQSSAGQISDLGQGFFLDFPKNAYELENGEDYNGEVTVISQVLSVDDPEMSNKMPGDLTGITSNGLTGTLGSLGMVEVELWSSDGHKIKIKEGMKVGIEFPVAPERVNLVPTTMPMWYFDELQGVWREDGLAILQGDHYVGTVSHFSFWNCDAWFDLVNWHCTFSHQNDAPVAFGQVCITIDRLQTRSCDYINQAGEISGKIAANEVMTMEVYGKCGSKIFTTKIGPFTQDAAEGPITVDDQSALCHLSGRVVDCNQQRITDGYVMCFQDHNYYTAELDHNTGAFSLSFNCCTEEAIKFQAVDRKTLATSAMRFSAFAPEIVMDTLVACRESEEYIYFETPQLNLPFFSSDIDIIGYGKDCAAVITSEDALHLFSLCLKNKGVGYYPGSECRVDLQLMPSDRGLCRQIDLQISEFGGFHGFIKGTFSGNFFVTDTSEFMDTYFKGGFSVRRD